MVVASVQHCGEGVALQGYSVIIGPGALKKVNRMWKKEVYPNAKGSERLLGYFWVV